MLCIDCGSWMIALMMIDVDCSDSWKEMLILLRHSPQAHGTSVCKASDNGSYPDLHAGSLELVYVQIQSNLYALCE